MRVCNVLLRFFTYSKFLVNGGLVAVALAGAPVAFAASNLQGFKNFNIATTGKVATVSPGSTSAQAGSFLGAVKQPENMSGWVPAGNYGAKVAASGPTMTTYHGGGDVFFAGTKYPFQAGYEVPATTLVDAVAAIAGGPLGVALFAAPFIANWLTDSGGRVNPSGTGLERQSDPTTTYTATHAGHSSDGTSALGAATTFVAWFNSTHSPSNFTVMSASDTDFTYSSPQCYCTYYGVMTKGATTPGSWLPSSMDDIAPYMSARPPPAGVTQEILDRGGEIPLPQPTITGPASIDGPESSTVNPDGTRTVTKTTMNFSPSTNTITNTSNVTNTTTYNVDNSVKSTSVTTVTPATDQDKQSECEKNPDSAGCSKLDLDKTEVPKIEKVVTYVEEDLGLGAGSCPSPITFHTSLTDGSISFTPYCNFLTTWVRPILILFAFLTAFFIIAPIKQE
ncbi:MAG: virulence factor TspB C-terminal domain-related protein [Rhodoferax sp.]|uniref:virulence factor TspB C-terminal domain-related protein n=1 Tax=Rhodoferax sp. TaxID=50421 RepID=UPI00271CF9EE|nr:virulence factor TspB C-terminal domain-related protein [Rhodoferax sp.]MDO8447545.1 virulence factor TspB C-terminal domain-related protein [Rhodoferax sp.]